MKRQTYKILEDADKTLLVSVGGNNKTKNVIELTLLPTFIIDNWDKLKEGETNSIKLGKVYVDILKELGLLKIVCPKECIHFQDNKCYVQSNPRNAAQVVGIVNAICGTLTLSEFTSWLKIQKLSGITDVRSMVAGDAGNIRESLWKPIESAILRVYPARKWLGYTHAWKRAEWLKKTHVASVETDADAAEAKAKGWNIFQSGDPLLETLPAGATLCPSSKQFSNYRGYKIACISCPIKCNGVTGNHVVIPRHGMGDTGRWTAAKKKGMVIKDSKGRIRGVY
jgi:hypothetical protein